MMGCGRTRRELLWLARFGELGPSSAPHLDHLASCRGCRDEVGFDRALVEQLRLALAERVADEEPSPAAWSVILARAQAPETGIGGFLRGHATGIASRLRMATAMSAMALAAVIATSTQVAITHSDAGSATTEVRASAAGELFERQPLVPRPRIAPTPVAYVPASTPQDPEAAFLVSASAAPAAAPQPAPPAEEPAAEPGISFGALINRLTPADAEDDPAPVLLSDEGAGDVEPAAGPY